MKSYTRLRFKKIDGVLESSEYLIPGRIIKALIGEEHYSIVDTQTFEVLHNGTREKLKLTKKNIKDILIEMGVNFSDEIRSNK